LKNFRPENHSRYHIQKDNDNVCNYLKYKYFRSKTQEGTFRSKIIITNADK